MSNTATIQPTEMPERRSLGRWNTSRAEMVYLSVLTQLFIEWSRLMNNSRLLALFCLLTISLIATGCGGGGGDSPESRSYLPLEVGNRWDYRMTLAPDVVPAQAAQNQIFDYHETVIGTANLQGEEYYIIQS